MPSDTEAVLRDIAHHVCGARLTTSNREDFEVIQCAIEIDRCPDLRKGTGK
jgi:hypothetical protein